MKTDKKENRSRPPKDVTPRLLRSQALRYLDRFAATSMKLKRHLMNKSKPSIDFHKIDPDLVFSMIETEIEKLVSAGILNDQEYASSKVRSMSRQAKSKLQMELKLQSLGFDDSETDQAITHVIEEEGHSDRIAAAKYIRKRRFGPFRPKDTRDDRLNKELASLVRNGFEFGLAQALLHLETPEEIEKIIYGE